MKLDMYDAGNTLTFEISIGRDDIAKIPDEKLEEIVVSSLGELTDDSPFDDKFAGLTALINRIRQEV